MEYSIGGMGRCGIGIGVQALHFVRRIVCNAGPLIALGLLGRLDILRSLFDEVLVPAVVQKEIMHGGLRNLGKDAFAQAPWIRAMQPKAADDLLMALLDGGEADVIAFAREEKITLVLIDERKARGVARNIYGLQAIGTVRILVEAKRKGLLAEVFSPLKTLRQEGYWIHEDIVQTALREAGEV